jgi:hypothetical protein
MQLRRGMHEPKTASQPPGGQLEPRQPVDGGAVRIGELAEVADQEIGSAIGNDGADPIAEQRQIAAPARRADMHDLYGAPPLLPSLLRLDR